MLIKLRIEPDIFLEMGLITYIFYLRYYIKYEC